MSDVISALYDDAAEYQALLKKYGVEPTKEALLGASARLGPMDYDHLDELRERRKRDAR